MIRKEVTDNYVLLEVGKSTMNKENLNFLESEIKVNTPDVLVDISKMELDLSPDNIESFHRISKLGNIVWIAGEEHYVKYNENDELTINVVPTVPEAADMLFMVKMENELGGDDFDV